MSTIKTRRDYHLTRFKIEKYLEKGIYNLTPAEEADLQQLSKDMSAYELVHFPMPEKKVLANVGTGYSSPH
jgi:hypothetical protein